MTVEETRPQPSASVDASARIAGALERIAACFESMAHDMTSTSVQANVMQDQVMGVLSKLFTGGNG